MGKPIAFTIVMALTALAAAHLVSAQVRRGEGIVPESSIERPRGYRPTNAHELPHPRAGGNDTAGGQPGRGNAWLAGLRL